MFLPTIATMQRLSDPRLPLLLPGSMPLPLISVVIATRNRGAAVIRAIESIVPRQGGADADWFELIIVDQSDDDSSAAAVAPYLGCPRIRYHKASSRGLGKARNEGMTIASSEWVAFTDDDCVVQPHWLCELQRACSVDSRISIVFGNVLEGHHDRAAGFITSYVRKGSYVARSLAQKHHVEGIGACMALRKSAWADLGGFDPLLGAGSRFHAAEELDFVMRALEAGHWVYETERAVVVHHGLRPHERKSALAHDYSFGIGAVYAKHLKCLHWDVLRPVLRLAWRWALGSPVVQYGTPPQRMPRLRGFLGGVLAGLCTPVDRAATLFRPAGGGPR
ncbi:MAG TPA: glycosyltransferase family A protein [Casimicrobiaceae bacterium]|nr:glycosyltransferase family A protein [Casimicrobiaceae bacterium]